MDQRSEGSSRQRRATRCAKVRAPHRRGVGGGIRRPHRMRACRPDRAGLPCRPRPVALVLLVAVALLLAACGSGSDPGDLGDAEAIEFIVPEAEPPDPSPDAEGDVVATDDADAGDGADDGHAADEGGDGGVGPDGLDPDLVALACEAVSDLAALGEPGPVEDRGELGVGELRDRMVGWQALLEVGYPDGGDLVVQLRLDVLEGAALMLDLLADEADSFADLDPLEYGVIYDQMSELVAVEDGDGGWVDLVGEPLVDDPGPLLAAGCNQDEVMYVVGRDAARLSGLEWPLGAIATDPDTVPFHDMLGIGGLVMDPDETDPRSWQCPMPAWSEDAQLALIAVNQWGVVATCDDLDGLQVTLSTNPSFVQEVLGEEPTLGDRVLVAEDGQAVAVRHLDLPVWAVARAPEDVEVPLDVLVDALLGGG